MLTVMATTDPAGGAFKQVIHYLQVARTSKLNFSRSNSKMFKMWQFPGEFRKYDYRDNNEVAYNQSEPPYYNLTDINDIPVYIWYGLNDYFSGALVSTTFPIIMGFNYGVLCRITRD